MKIANLPVKYPEIGRIRLGIQEEGKRNPTALDRFRFTSADEMVIKAVASLYGGETRKWDKQFEVVSDSNSLDILLPADPIFAAYEKWGSGGNQRRCDGERCMVPVQSPDGGYIDEVDCLCDTEGKVPGEDRDACNITVRLKVVLPRVPGFGIWMMTTGSIYAAMELPAQVGLIESIRRGAGVNIPCDLVLEYREEKRTYEKYARKYHVPVLRVRESVERLTASLAQPLGPSRSLAPVTSLDLPAPGAAPPATVRRAVEELPPEGQEDTEPPGQQPLLQTRSQQKG